MNFLAKLTYFAYFLLVLREICTRVLLGENFSFDFISDCKMANSHKLVLEGEGKKNEFAPTLIYKHLKQRLKISFKLFALFFVR